MFVFLTINHAQTFANAESSLESSINDISNSHLDNDNFNQDDFLVLQVNVSNSLILSESIIGYYDGSNVFLSLKDFVSVLEFPINFQNNKVANGWFINEKQTFNFDYGKKKCVSGNKNFSLLKKEMIIFHDEIFVDIKTLKKWFNLDLFFSQTNQEIIVNSGGLLPIEQRFERQQEWQKIIEEQEMAKNQNQDAEANVVVEDNYKLVSVPFGDINYSHNYSESGNSSTSSSRINALFAGDFLYLNNQAFASTEDSKLVGFRLTSGRYDPQGKLLGSLGATNFSLGDIFTPESPLVARSIGGRGATISNYPLEYVNQFNKVLIRGNAQPNWDVEIYRNDSLLNFQKVSSQGLYEFVDVPLISGLNIIKLVFYGPFGQRLEENRRYMVGNDLLKKGKVYYRFAANENNKDLIDVKPKNSGVVNSKNYGSGRLFGELGYGITDSTSIVANFIKIPILESSDQQNEYAGISLRSSFLGISARIDNVKDLITNFDAQELSLQTTLFKSYNISSIFDRYDKDFTSESHQPNTDPLLYRSAIRLDGPFRIPFTNFPSFISINTSRENYDSDKIRDDIESELYFGITRKLSLTENIKYIKDERISGNLGEIVQGRTLMNYFISDSLIVRGSLFYNIKPSDKLTSVDLSTSYNFGDNYNLSSGVNHQFANGNTDEITGYNATISKTFDKFLLSFGGNYNTEGNFGTNLTLSTSFGYDQQNNIGIISGFPLATRGAVGVKVFLDENNSGKFDKGEETFKDIEVIVNGRRSKTNDDGVAIISNIQLDVVSQISINNDSLPDPYLIARKKNVRIIAHSGTITNISFPISRVGEISGYVITEKSESTINPASNVELELINKKTDKVLSKVKSGYDGFYVFEMVPFDNYIIRISPTQSKRLNFFVSPEYNVKLNENDQEISEVNFAINYNKIPDSLKSNSENLNKNPTIKPVKYIIKNVKVEKNEMRSNNDTQTENEEALNLNTKRNEDEKKRKKYVFTKVNQSR